MAIIEGPFQEVPLTDLVVEQNMFLCAFTAYF